MKWYNKNKDIITLLLAYFLAIGLLVWWSTKVSL